MESQSLLSDSPVEIDTLASSSFSGGGIVADRAPDLFLELSGSNIITEELVVYAGQYGNQVSTSYDLQQ
jgi:hypothetical protein